MVTADSEPRPSIVAGLAPPQLARISTKANQVAMQEQRHILLSTKNSNRPFEYESSSRRLSDPNHGQIQPLLPQAFAKPESPAVSAEQA